VNPVDAFSVGIAPMHVPALVAALLLPVLVLAVRRLRTPPGAVRPYRPGPGPVRTWAAWLLGITGAVHLALPLGHFDRALLTIAFVGSGAAYSWLAMRAYEGRSWRLPSALLLVGTLTAYLVVTGTGGEEPDQVGIATALVELLALGLCLVPVREPGRRRRFARFAGSTATLVLTFLIGTIIWVGSFAAHAATDADVADVAANHEAAVSGVAHRGDHEHEHAARAQAGVIMRPSGGHHPTPEQAEAAAGLATATRDAMVRYASLDAALADGYELPKPGTGTDVHMEHKGHMTDGLVLDPQRPETLVYAIEGGRATLLGVVYVMERAGVPGPEPGGPITRWHAHNICLTALPPGFGIVTPFGSCPALSVNVTTPEMMHVWVVDSPAGPFAEGLDQDWVRAYHAEHGLPVPAR
jgi:hypothetical protein